MHIIDLIEKVVEDIKIDGLPNFSYEYWNGEFENLTSYDAVQIMQDKKFPLVFLLLPLDYEELEDKTFAETDISLYIFAESDLNYTTKERHTLTFPILRDIKERLKSSLKNNGCDYKTVKVKEIFYNKAEKNKLESVIDAIYIKIPKLKYKFINC